MGTKFSNIFEAHVVVIPSVQILSLTAIGTPSRTLSLSPVVNRLFASHACFLAISLVVFIYAFKHSVFSILSKHAFINSTGPVAFSL